MQNEKNGTKKYDLQVEKVIAKSPADVFRAIGEGRLFLNCSAKNETLKIDFKVGGSYRLDFTGYDKSNQGEFLEIVPHQKIVFTWCQNPEVSDTPDTTVTIELKEQGGKTHLTLTHVGFKDQEVKDNHQGGWNGGLDDLSAEIAQGKLRFMRFFKVPVQKLYEKCADPTSFFGMLGNLQKGHVDFKVGGSFQLPTKNGEISGKFLEIIPNQKIVFSWESTCGEKMNHDTKVTLNFESEDEEESWLELIHEGLDSEAHQKSHRAGWDWLLNQMQ